MFLQEDLSFELLLLSIFQSTLPGIKQGISPRFNEYYHLVLVTRPWHISVNWHPVGSYIIIFDDVRTVTVVVHQTFRLLTLKYMIIFSKTVWKRLYFTFPFNNRVLSCCAKRIERMDEKNIQLYLSEKCRFLYGCDCLLV